MVELIIVVVIVAGLAVRLAQTQTFVAVAAGTFVVATFTVWWGVPTTLNVVTRLFLRLSGSM